MPAFGLSHHPCISTIILPYAPKKNLSAYRTHQTTAVRYQDLKECHVYGACLLNKLWQDLSSGPGEGGRGSLRCRNLYEAPIRDSSAFERSHLMLVPGVVLYTEPSLGFIATGFRSVQNNNKKINGYRICPPPIGQAVWVGPLRISFEKEQPKSHRVNGRVKFMQRVRFPYLV